MSGFLRAGLDAAKSFAHELPHVHIGEKGGDFAAAAGKTKLGDSVVDDAAHAATKLSFGEKFVKFAEAHPAITQLGLTAGVTFGISEIVGELAKATTQAGQAEANGEEPSLVGKIALELGEHPLLTQALTLAGGLGLAHWGGTKLAAAAEKPAVQD